MKTFTAGPEHIVMDGFKACVGREGADIDALEILAIASQFVGNLIAVQDCRRYSSAMILEMVGINIEVGNRIAVETLVP